MVALVFSCKSSKKEETDMKKEEVKQEISATISLSKAEFLKKVVDYEGNPTEWKYLGDKPCIVDFYASWCGPCRMIAPILEELSGEYAGKIYIYKIDVDKERDLAAAFGIRSIPALLFIPMNDKPIMHQGVLSKGDFIKMINEALLKINEGHIKSGL